MANQPPDYKALQGYFYLTLGQASVTMSRTWNVDSLFDVLSNIGGLAVSVVGFFQFCFSPRTEYSYDISRLKRFYYFAKED